MNCKLPPSTMSVILVKTIKTLCEINIDFNQHLEIYGSIHIRADGEKVLSCLVNEEARKDDNNVDGLSSSKISELVSRLGLTGTALNYLTPQGGVGGGEGGNGQATDLSSLLLSPSTHKLIQQHFEQQQQQIQKQQEQLQHINDQLSQKYNQQFSQQSTAVQQFTQLLDRALEQSKAGTVELKGLDSFTDNTSLDQLGEPSTSYQPDRCAPRRVGRPCRRRTVNRVFNSAQGYDSSRGSVSDPSAIKLPDIETLAQQLPGFLTKDADLSSLDGSFMGSHGNSDSLEQSTADVIDRLLVSMPSYVVNDGNDGHSSGAQNGDALTADVDALIQEAVGASGRRSKKYQCPFCGIYLSTKCYLKNHVNSMHTRTRVFNCEDCAHRFYSAGALRIHRLRNHWVGARKHRCALCDESFLLPIELRKHIQKKHPDCGSTYQKDGEERKPDREAMKLSQGAELGYGEVGQ